MNPEHKPCGDCGVDKPASEFYVIKGKYLQWRCKECHKVKMRVSSANRKDYLRFKSKFRGGSGNSGIDIGLAILVALTNGRRCLNKRFISCFCECTPQSILNIERRAMKKVKDKMMKSGLIRL